MRRTCTESVERARGVPTACGQDEGSLAAGGGAAWPAASSAIAHRRGPLPAAPMPRTPPQHAPHRYAPWVTRSASWLGRSSRARCAGRRAKGHRHRAGTPRIVRLGPSSVKGTPRSFLTASQKRSSGPTLERRSLCRPSGPDGEGQARGQARTRAANLPTGTYWDGRSCNRRL
jgi:hypothetical protein